MRALPERTSILTTLVDLSFISRINKDGQEEWKKANKSTGLRKMT